MKRTFAAKAVVAALGVVFCLLLLEVGVRVAGYVFLSLQENRNRAAIRQKGAYRIMCVGESTTALYGKDSYPSQLEDVLNQRAVGVRFSVINKGIPAGNTTCILTELADNLDLYHPDMVIAMMGINDGGNYVAYKKPDDIGVRSLFRAFKTYKLAELLWFHVVSKHAALRGDEPAGNIADVLNAATWPKSTKDLAQKEPSFGRNPNWRYLELADSYAVRGKYKEAGECYEKIIKSGLLKAIMELHPKYCWAYILLGESYKKQGRYTEAEAVYKKIVEISPDAGYLELAILYQELGKTGAADEYFKKAREFQAGYYNPITRHNYNKMREILAARGIRLVSVQYPTRSIAPLQKMLPPEGDVIFVDNEAVFKNALAKNDYDRIFSDSCYGDFGHCTKVGCRLLAENIADVVLAKLFSAQKSPGAGIQAQGKAEERYLLKRRALKHGPLTAAQAGLE